MNKGELKGEKITANRGTAKIKNGEIFLTIKK